MIHKQPRMVATRTESRAQIVTRLHFHELTSFEVVMVNEAADILAVTLGLPSVVMFVVEHHPARRFSSGCVNQSTQSADRHST